MQKTKDNYQTLSVIVSMSCQRIILELSNLVEVTTGQAWGVKPVQGPLNLPGTCKFSPGPTIEKKTNSNCQSCSGQKLLPSKMKIGGRFEAEIWQFLTFLAAKAARDLAELLSDIFNSHFRRKYKWKTIKTVHNPQFTIYNYFIVWFVVLFICITQLGRIQQFKLQIK